MNTRLRQKPPGTKKKKKKKKGLDPGCLVEKKKLKFFIWHCEVPPLYLYYRAYNTLFYLYARGSFIHKANTHRV